MSFCIVFLFYAWGGRKTIISIDKLHGKTVWVLGHRGEKRYQIGLILVIFVLARVTVLRKDNTLRTVNHKLICNVVCQSVMYNMVDHKEINTTMIHKVVDNTVIHKVTYSYLCDKQSGVVSAKIVVACWRARHGYSFPVK